MAEMMDGMGASMMGEEESGESPVPSLPSDPFELEATTFLDDALPMPERITALKEAIRLCLEEDQAGGYDSDKPKGGDAGLALIFEGGGKKK